MVLDTRTIMVMFCTLAIMFAGLLALAGLSAGNIKGVKQWAASNLCLGLALSPIFFFTKHTPGYHWAIVFSVHRHIHCNFYQPKRISNLPQ